MTMKSAYDIVSALRFLADPGRGAKPWLSLHVIPLPGRRRGPVHGVRSLCRGAFVLGVGQVPVQGVPL